MRNGMKYVAIIGIIFLLGGSTEVMANKEITEELRSVLAQCNAGYNQLEDKIEELEDKIEELEYNIIVLQN